jgi:hypothetical protein
MVKLKKHPDIDPDKFREEEELLLMSQVKLKNS